MTRAALTVSSTEPDAVRPASAPRRRARRVLVGGVALALVLGLSGCGEDSAPRPGAAVVMGDLRISEADLQQATKEVNNSVGLEVGNPNGVPQTTVLTWLVLRPELQRQADQQRLGLTESDLQTQLANLRRQFAPEGKKDVAYELSPIGREAWLGYLTLTPLLKKVGESVPGEDQDGAKAEKAIKDWWKGVLAAVTAKDPKVNPRYGTYAPPNVDEATQVSDLLNIIKPPADNWNSSNTPSPSASAEPTPSPENS